MRSPIGQQIDRIFDRRHVTARTCHQHALRHPAAPSLVHERPDRTAYFEAGSQWPSCTVLTISSSTATTR